MSEGTVELKYCPTEQMLADMLRTVSAVFEKLRNETDIVPVPVQFSIKWEGVLAELQNIGTCQQRT